MTFLLRASCGLGQRHAASLLLAGRPARRQACGARVVQAAAGEELKRPPNAYARFIKDNFASTKARLGKDVPLGDVAKDVGAQWKRLGAAEKKSYQDEYARAKEVYEASLPPREPKPVVVKEKKSRPAREGPAKLSGYQLYIKENASGQAKDGDLQRSKLTLAAQAWKGLSEADKEDFKQRAKALNAAA